MLDGWRVDPDRIVGVLAGIDDDGAGLARAPRVADELVTGQMTLRIDDRTAVARAWGGFMEERRHVPGKLIHALVSSAHALSEATVAVVAGDEQMAVDAGAAEAQVLDRWGIDSVIAYGGGALSWG